MVSKTSEKIKKKSSNNSSSSSYIEIKGAKVHNLKNVNLSIPKNQLIVVTGVSGSGKSSLVMDVLFAEGQRKYVESLSSYARQFLTRMDKPDVDYIKGLCPAIAIEQKVNSKNSRSTVGTLTEIYEYLKLLFARVGKTYSPVSGKIVRKNSVSDVVDYIFSLQENTKIQILVSIDLHDRKSESYLNTLLQSGFSRIVQNETAYRIDSILEKEKTIDPKKSSYLLIDRITVKKEDEDLQNRVADSVNVAFYEGKGVCIVDIIGDSQKMFSNNFELDGITFEEPTPNLFSFNNPFGACKTCEGFGTVIGIDEDLVVPDPNLSVFEGAIACWKGEKMKKWKNDLIKNALKFDFPIHRAYKDLSEAEKKVLWEGNEYFKGINGFFTYLESKGYKIQYRVILSRYRGRKPCHDCQGTRIRKDANYVKIQHKSITDLLLMPVDECIVFFENIKLTKHEQTIASRVLYEVKNRLSYLQNVGLGYLTLNRSSSTLSGGETQRINLTRTLGSNLTSSLYILDEPSIGLHSQDTKRLVTVLKRLRDLGNSVIVVEHDEDIMQHADWIIDIGPLAGKFGGEVVAQGDFATLLKDVNSLTGRFLSNQEKIEIPRKRRTWNNKIEVLGAYQNNLKNIDVTFPLNCLVAVSGVSGSGKTTLVKQILYPAIHRNIESSGDRPGKHTNITGSLDQIKHIELIDQRPLGRSSRSNPVTYVKAYDAIRDLYSNQQLSKIRDFKPKHFSFNVEGGRCETCKGEGEILVEMQFLADVRLQCESCNGQRFKKEVREVKYKNMSISDVLNLSVDEALDFFHDHKEIMNKLSPLASVGLGYVSLGQSSSTLSGGEAQRVKLASFLSKGNNTDPILFIFDEPTTGLHFNDIKKLLFSFNALIEKGHSIIVVEHNMDVIKCADWVIDLGPEGGKNGGHLVFQGTPEALSEISNSKTAPYLKQKLA